MTTRLAAVALMLGNLVIGLSVMAPAGMLNELADGLSVTIRDAGLLVTFGAVVLCFGSPLVAWATTRVDRRTLLGATLAIVGLGHAASAFAPDYTTLLVVRLLMLIAAAVFTPQAASTIGMIVPEKERSGAIAFVFLGWSLAVAAGLPLVTFIAAHGGWRMVHVMLAALSALNFALLLFGLPSRLPGTPMSLKNWGTIMQNPRIVLLLLATLLATAGQFMLFVYFGPLLTTLVGAGPGTIGAFFAAGGVMGFIGNVLATRAVGAIGPYRTSLFSLSFMLAGMLIWSAGAGFLWIMAAGTVVMGLGFAAANSMQQARLAGAAPTLAGASIALNTSSIYVGQALGSFVGGVLFTQGFVLTMGYIGTVFMALALLVVLRTRDAPSAVPAGA